MKTYKGVEIWLHTFLASTLPGSDSETYIDPSDINEIFFRSNKGLEVNKLTLLKTRIWLIGPNCRHYLQAVKQLSLVACTLAWS
jgi:hypothetical protein